MLIYNVNLLLINIDKYGGTHLFPSMFHLHHPCYVVLLYLILKAIEIKLNLITIAIQQMPTCVTKAVTYLVIFKLKTSASLHIKVHNPILTFFLFKLCQKDHLKLRENREFQCHLK